MARSHKEAARKGESGDVVLASVEDLELGLVRIARIIERHGDKYMSIFLLIEEALTLAKARQDARARVRAVLERAGKARPRTAVRGSRLVDPYR